MAKQHPENSAEALGGILASWSVSFLRVVLVGFVIAPTLGNLLGKTLFGAMFILLAASGFFYWRASQRADPTALILKDPFELAVVLRFAAVFIAVLFAVKFASRLFGDGGIISVSAISGAVDVDPILLSLAQGVSHGAQHQTAARAILVAVAANTFFKCGLSAFFGGLRIASTLIGIGVVAIGTAAMAFRFFG